MENKFKSKSNFYNSNRQADTKSLKDVINSFLETYRLQRKYKETFLISSWDKIVGAPIAARTTKIYIQNKKMYVQLSSAPLKNELTMSKAKILQLLYDALGEKIVEDIFFM